MKIEIREERAEDRFDVEKMTREAFWNQEQYEKMNIGATEHYLVHILRETIAVPKLNLVALLDGQIVGHILLNRACYVIDGDQKTEVLSLAPLTVAKAYQNQGIGTLLTNHCIQLAKKTDYPAIILYGHPAYYPRFGFRNAEAFEITTDKGENFDAFMVLEMHPGSLKNIKGRFVLNRLFDEEQYLPDAVTYDKMYFSK